MAQVIQLRRGTANEWTTANPILAEGELGFEIDSTLYKIGDGLTTWSALSYAALSPELSAITTVVPSSEPTPPESGRLRLYPWKVGGRTMLKWVGASGLDTTVQPAVFGNGVMMYAPASGTGITVWGGPGLTQVGTMTTPGLAAGGQRVSTRRWLLTSAATAGSVASSRIAQTIVYRGEAPGLGGFFTVVRFACPSAIATQQGFVGLWSSTGAVSATQTTNTLTNCLGIGFDIGDANLSFYNNDASGTPTKTDLGANFPVTPMEAVYELAMFAAPNDDQVAYRVTRIDTRPTAVVTGVVTTDIPTNTTFLTFQSWINNGTTAASVLLELMRVYVETDN
jgi:hypothetical protein